MVERVADRGIGRRARGGVVLVVLATSLAAVSAQTPRPFPTPTPRDRPPASPAAPPRGVATAVPPPAAADGAPTEAELGVTVYPTAQFLASYDAGRGQRFYLFGVTADYAQIVQYYQTVLREDGDEVFEGPASHMFETGRFRDETMAFPPSVTVKDFAWNGLPGYPNPQPGATPTYFPTIIQIVPPPANVAQR